MIDLSSLPTLTRNDHHPHGRHYYDAEGCEYVSVTTVANMIDKPYLKNWAAKMERNHVFEKVQGLYHQLPSERVHVNDFMGWLKSFFGKKYQHELYTSAAADWGTQLHNYLEYQLRTELGWPVEEAEPPLPPGGELARDRYVAWRQANDIQMYGPEIQVYSRDYGYAGTMDWLGWVMLTQRMTVGDWKSSSGLHVDMVLQNAAYVHAVIEMGLAEPPIDGLVIRFPKNAASRDIEVLPLPWEVQGEAFEAFTHALALWRWNKAWEAKLK